MDYTVNLQTVESGPSMCLSRSCASVCSHQRVTAARYRNRFRRAVGDIPVGGYKHVAPPVTFPVIKTRTGYCPTTSKEQAPITPLGETKVRPTQVRSWQTHEPVLVRYRGSDEALPTESIPSHTPARARARRDWLMPVPGYPARGPLAPCRPAVGSSSTRRYLLVMNRSHTSRPTGDTDGTGL